jgi:hypothetical protein
MMPARVRVIAESIVIVASLFATERGQSTDSSSGTPLVAPSCTDSDYRQFDFWVGDWDVFDIAQPATRVAHARVELILDGCVVHEIYEATDGHKGESLSIYDASRRTWHQSWVTNRGQLLTIEGQHRGDAMVLIGTDHLPDGRARAVRGVWRPDKDGVRETASRSTDAGVSWTPWFDLVFRRHAR